jgi:uncharacterized low-complexity protein
MQTLIIIFYKLIDARPSRQYLYQVRGAMSVRGLSMYIQVAAWRDAQAFERVARLAFESHVSNYQDSEEADDAAERDCGEAKRTAGGAKLKGRLVGEVLRISANLENRQFCCKN